jgi:hypothetical protein
MGFTTSHNFLEHVWSKIGGKKGKQDLARVAFLKGRGEPKKVRKVVQLPFISLYP